jgi:uncharacterized membrane protein SpoIIM required for sporulation
MVKKKQKNQNVLIEYLLRFQWIALIAAIIVFSFGFLEAFVLFRNHCSNSSVSNSVDVSCSTPFCRAVKESFHTANSNTDKISKIGIVAKTIFLSNLKATGYEVTSIKFYGFAPVLSLYRHSLQVGLTATCYPSKLSMLLLPHGWIEIISMLLFFSLFYSFVINLLLVLSKEESLKRLLVRTSIQIGIIVLLYLIAAILESISFISRFN